jgi:hypothetical protein
VSSARVIPSTALGVEADSLFVLVLSLPGSCDDADRPTRHTRSRYNMQNRREPHSPAEGEGIQTKAIGTSGAISSYADKDRYEQFAVLNTGHGGRGEHVRR